ENWFHKASGTIPNLQSKATIYQTENSCYCYPKYV
ncbi:Abnormal spindle-like microcephaly-associated, partial [Araneus ventricosus]